MRRQGTYPSGYKKSPVEASSSDESKISTIPSKRKVNIYDAVAGRVTQAGLIGNIADVKKGSKQPLRPDEVLFKQAHAPIRYEETDYYHAHANLSDDQQLPSSDLLNAIHAYISRLYARTEEPATKNAWKCMDETALIALGILMEESAREALGATGDLAFTEAADEEEERAFEGDDEDDDEEEKGSTRSTSKDVKTREAHSNSWSSSDTGSQYTTEESNQ